jgi:hypothetical protein
MAIARVQVTSTGVEGSALTTLTTANFASGVTSGNYVIVGIRTSTNIDLVSVADTLLSSYSLAIADFSSDPAMHIYYAKLASSGTNAVTGVWGAGIGYAWVFAIEVSGLAASSVLDAVDEKSGTGVTDLVSDAISTAQADEYVVAFGSQNNFAAYTAGTDFTIVDGTIPDATGNKFGGCEERITSGTLSSYTVHLTSDVTNNYRMVVATFKGDGGGGGGGNPWYAYAQQ